RPAARRPASGARAGPPRPSRPEWRPPTGRRRGSRGRPRGGSCSSAGPARGRGEGRPSASTSAHTPLMKAIRIGCSGWMYDSWRGRLYPERCAKRRWLEVYARHYDTVEVNSTFYRLARRSAVEGWVSQTSPEFLFAVKASRYLTHIKRLLDIRDGIARFYEPLEPMIEAGRLGPVLWQLPENFHRDDQRLA